MQLAAAQTSAISTSGRDAILIDEDGREYLDALAGLWNVIVGHGRAEPSAASAAAEQMERLAFAFEPTRGQQSPARSTSPSGWPGFAIREFQRFFDLLAAGAEANEAAFKTARFYWKAARPARQNRKNH